MLSYFTNKIHTTSFSEVDVTAAGIGILSLFKYLPELSAGLSLIWVGLRIYILIRDELFGKGKKNGDE